MSSITNSMEMVLRSNVEVRIIHLPEDEVENLLSLNQAESTMKSEKEKRQGHANGLDTYSTFPLLLDGNFQTPTDASDFIEGNGVRENGQEIPSQRIESIIREQRLETALLQDAEKGSPGSLSCVRPEKNQVLPQENIGKDPIESIDHSTRFSSQQLEYGQNHEFEVLNVDDGQVQQKEQISGRVDRGPMSPSLLHGSSLATSSSKDNL